MNKDQLFLSTICDHAGPMARKYGLGLEIAEFATGSNLDRNRDNWQLIAKISNNVYGVRRRLIHGPFNELFPCAIDPKARDLAKTRFIQSIRMAINMEADGVILHSGYTPQMYYDQWFQEQSILFWRKFFEDQNKMKLYVENVLETRPEPLLAVLEGVNQENLRVCLDVGHINAYSKVPAVRWLKTLAPWIGHFHLHNNDGTWDHHNPLDQGTVPMEEFLGMARELCPHATYTLELTDPESSLRWLTERGILEGDCSFE